MIKILKHLTKKDWLFVLLSLAFIVAGVWLDLLLPDYMNEITTLVQTPGSEMGDVISVGLMMLLVAMGSLLCAVIVGFFVARIAANLGMTLRKKAYTKTISFSKEEIGKFSIPSLITRSTNDITQIQTFVTLGLQATIKAPIMAVWAISKIMGKSFSWSLATGIAVLCMITVFAIFLAIALPRFSKVQKLTDDVNRVSRESITGVRAVRAYNAQSYQEKKFKGINDTLRDENLVVTTTFSFLQPAMTLIMMGLSLAIYLIGAFAIGNAGMSDRLAIFAEMIVFSSYAVQVIAAFFLIAISSIILPRAAVSAKRLNEMFETKSKIVYGDKTGDDTFEKGTIRFENVCFKYPGAQEYTLKNINFSAKKGETVAFIGSTGSGKSTLVDLIPRFYDPTEGEIYVDNMNIKQFTKEDLCDKLGYVSQKAVLFQGSVSSNIAYGDTKQTDHSLVVESSEIAMAYEFISKMDEGYDAMISQGGANVSGGQKQRLSIARAIYKRPEIYIFDDSFCALDYQTDRTLRGKLKRHFSAVTTLIVAQRVGTIMNADKIIVLDKGEIVGQGTHKQLLDTCDVYKQIAQSQLSEEEMKNAG